MPHEERMKQMELKGSRTEANLMAAIAGESQARNKYIYYAWQARKDGYEQIADVFEETAANEQTHAYLWTLLVHRGIMPKTEDALKDAAGGEHYEWSEMYKNFAEQARQEGFGDIAAQFERVALVEYEHEKRFNKLAQNIGEQTVFRKDAEQRWICRFCGYIHEGASAPVVCPLCKHPQAFFEIKAENY